MFHHKSDSMLINQSLALLAGIHQALLADPVNYPGNAGGALLDYIHRNICKQILAAASIPKMGSNVFLRLRPVQMTQHAVDINPLADGRIPL